MKKKDKPPRRMRAVASDIIKKKFLSKKELKQLTSKFYAIMNKHGIKQGTRIEPNAVQISNAEWTMCQDLFMKKIDSQLQTAFIFDKLPKELEAYD